jgi:hypothetical protein
MDMHKYMSIETIYMFDVVNIYSRQHILYEEKSKVKKYRYNIMLCDVIIEYIISMYKLISCFLF